MAMNAKRTTEPSPDGERSDVAAPPTAEPWQGIRAGMRTSCGVLILSPAQELLMVHATGTPRWDIPKGLAEVGESPGAAAMREVEEETGLRLEASALLDLGCHPYLPGKNLHLFAITAARWDLAACRCSTSFADRHARLRPEVDAWEWVPFAQAPQRCGKAMAALLARLLPLEVALGCEPGAGPQAPTV
jgi:putative (di)nucleoside polyphosphate hydrolase